MDIESLLPYAQITAAIAAPLLIAFATTFSSSKATREAHRFDRQRRAAAAAQEMKSVLWGIHAELVTTVEHYRDTVGRDLEAQKDKDQPYTGYMLAEQSYCTIYEQSADRLGSLDDAELLQNIVRTYTTLRALIDAHIIQRGIVDVPQGKRSTTWSERGIAHKQHLLKLHHELIALTTHTVRLLKERHGPLRPGENEEFRAASS